MKQSPPPQRRSSLVGGGRLRRRSPKRAAQETEYTKLRRAWLTENPMCGVCSRNWATDIHHKRGRRGALLLDQRWWVQVCRSCHDRIETDRDWARAQGWQLPRTAA